jgi:predicted DNA-binding transcriptional regulator YafY
LRRKIILMAVNKNALIRYHAIDKCLRNPGRKYFIEDLVEACSEAILAYDTDSSGIQKRQVQYDINFMKSESGWSAPIESYKDGKKKYYRYDDPDFSINKQPLNDSEAEQIRSALHILSRFQGMPQFNWVSEMIPKLEQKFQLNTNSAHIISFDSNEYLTGIEHLGPLFNYILNKRTLEITYKSFKSETARTFVIHPYHLKQFNNRWFMFGLNSEYHSIYNLPLDRIVEIQESKVKFIENKEIDFNEYFEDIIGVTKPAEGKVEKIMLKFTAEQAPYILTKPIHGSMKKISNDENGLVASIEVIPNFELEKLILSFGDAVKVIEPLELTEKIKQKLKSTIDFYSLSS